MTQIDVSTRDEAPATLTRGGDVTNIDVSARDEAPATLTAILALWEDARLRGWEVQPDAQTGAWKAHDARRRAGMCYDPPGPVSVGVVSAYDDDSTLTMTGVTVAGDAVGVLRGFFGWANEARELVGVGGAR